MNHRAVQCWAVTKADGRAITVEAHRLTIETAGALAFWAVDETGNNAWLMFAFNDWKNVVISVPREAQGGDSVELDAMRGPYETPVP